MNEHTTKWIKVSERLPDPSKYDWVLVNITFDEDGSYGVPTVAEYRKGEWWDLLGDKLSELEITVTHWMPLPEPPKEGADDKQIEEMGVVTDLLIDFDEMGFSPTTACPDPEAYAIEWREKLTNALKGYRKASEVAREIFAEIEKYMMVSEDITHTLYYTIGVTTFAELKKKYITEEGK